MLSILCFKWQPNSLYRSRYKPEQVNILRAMLERNLKIEHELVCATDDPAGIDPKVRIIPIWNDYADLTNPNGAYYPSCYRRLKLFDGDFARKTIGKRFAWIDLDVVITGDMTPLLDTTEDFKIYDEGSRNSYYNGTMLIMNAGARQKVWDTFKKSSVKILKGKGITGSDQAWVSNVLGPGQPTWTFKDGFYAYRRHVLNNRNGLPKDARIVSFHGNQDPWLKETISTDPWITDHYHL